LAARKRNSIIPAPAPASTARNPFLCTATGIAWSLSVSVHLFQRHAGAAHHAGQRVVGDDHRQAGFFHQQAVEVAQQRAAAGQHHAAFGDVGAEFGRRLLQRLFTARRSG
jgi:hypothetical protein